MMKNYYEILGLPRYTESQEQIKAAYRKKLVQAQTDEREIALETCKALDLIMEVFNDPEKKAAYDARLEQIHYFDEPEVKRREARALKELQEEQARKNALAEKAAADKSTAQLPSSNPYIFLLAPHSPSRKNLYKRNRKRARRRARGVNLK